MRNLRLENANTKVPTPERSNALKSKYNQALCKYVFTFILIKSYDYIISLASSILLFLTKRSTQPSTKQSFFIYSYTTRCGLPSVPYIFNIDKSTDGDENKSD